jgi:hypothetical protein
LGVHKRAAANLLKIFQPLKNIRTKMLLGTFLSIKLHRYEEFDVKNVRSLRIHGSGNSFDSLSAIVLFALSSVGSLIDALMVKKEVFSHSLCYCTDLLKIQR